MIPPWSLTYHGGSGNGFHARDDGDGASFEYEPVRPETSSSGLYSGGSAKRGALSPAEVASLWEHVHALEADPSLRSEVRAKGTGALTVCEAQRSRELVVQRGAALAALDAWIAAR